LYRDPIEEAYLLLHFHFRNTHTGNCLLNFKLTKTDKKYRTFLLKSTFATMAIFSLSSNSLTDGIDSSLCQSRSNTKNVPARQRDCKTDGKPKRNLSSYNIFFQYERAKILSHEKVGFEDLGRKIASRWNSLNPEIRDHFDDLAAEDKARYKREMKKWKKSRKADIANSQGLSQVRGRISTKIITHAPPNPSTSNVTIVPNHTSTTPPKKNNRSLLANLSFDPSFNNVQQCNSIPNNPPLPAVQTQDLRIHTLAEKLDDDCIDLLLALIW